MKQLSVVIALCGLLLVGCQTTQSVVAPKNSKENRIDVRIRWAMEHIQKGQYEEAKHPLTAALEIDSRHPKVLNLLAFVFQQQGEMELAEDYYKKMLSADSDFAAGLNNYGIFLMLQGRYEQACSYLDRASANPLYQGRPEALENLASCYMLTKRTELAEQTYHKVLRLRPNSAIAIVELAALAYERGDSGQAWQLFNRFSDMVNSHQVEHTAKSLWLGVRLSREGGDPSMAATYALLLKNLFPSSLEYQLYKESRK